MAAESRLATVDGADFPLVVLDAYWKGAQLMAQLNPGCGVPWWGLAGIGKVESRHGTYGGAEVRPDGSLTRPIIGIPLTGFGGTAAIGDSDGGAVDGDPTVDRAAGLMQFIPQTWRAWGRDGDANGQIEIQNIYDAAAGAAAYLCASGPLADDTGLSRGYFSYNHSLDYVASVLAEAKGYAAAVTLPAG
jgi:membrane-bound lytic murein transglycosylase B